jgi:O-antigen/teichoic acid export membrane protein
VKDIIVFVRRLISLNSTNNGVFIIFIHRFWQSIAGAITLFFLAHFLTPIEQGYYYTLSSIAALYMVFDMGLGNVLIQFSAREFVRLSWGKAGKVKGISKSKLLTLIKLSIIWYGLAAIIFLLIYPVGIYYIDSSNSQLSYDWHLAWFLLVLSVSILLLILPILSITEGSGRITEVYILRLLQGIIGSIFIWIVLINNGGLYAVVMIPLCSAIIAVIWLIIRMRNTLIQAFQLKSNKLNWRSEVWPLQWRVGTSWFSGYVLVLMHAPILFYTQGPVEAGQMGITITTVNMLCILSFSWVTSQIPTMTELAFLNNWSKLDKIYWGILKKSSITYILGAIILFIVRLALEGTEYSSRVLPITETAWLLVAMGFYHVSSIFAAYLRIYMQEPFFLPAIIGSILTLIFTFIASQQWGISGVVGVLVTINAFFFFPIVLWMWAHYKKKWQG